MGTKQIKLNQSEVKDKLYNLCTELAEAEDTKRDLNRAHGENIKRIKAEIKDLLKDDTANTVAEE